MVPLGGASNNTTPLDDAFSVSRHKISQRDRKTQTQTQHRRNNKKEMKSIFKTSLFLVLGLMIVTANMTYAARKSSSRKDENKNKKGNPTTRT